VEHRQLREGRPKPQGASREQSENQEQFEDHHVDAGRGDERVGNQQEGLAVESRTRDPLRIEFDDARPEIEQHDEVPDGHALSGNKQEREHRPVEHVVLVEPQPVILEEKEAAIEEQCEQNPVTEPRETRAGKCYDGGQGGRQVVPEQPAERAFGEP
jgi:hypothetical protein